MIIKRQKEFRRAIPETKVSLELMKRGYRNIFGDSAREALHADGARYLYGGPQGQGVLRKRNNIFIGRMGSRGGYNQVNANINLRGEVQKSIKDGTASFGTLVNTKGGTQYNHLKDSTKEFVEGLKSKIYG